VVNYQKTFPACQFFALCFSSASDLFCSNFLFSTQISEDSFILSKKWRMHLNPEAGSISTDYDPNSSTIGESQSASSGYWSRGEKEEDKVPEKTPLDLDLEQIRPESLRLPEQTHVHRTQHEQISQNQLGKVHITNPSFEVNSSKTSNPSCVVD